ncbi:MAG: acyl-CoA thioesterase [Victivallales bacterium]|nr:acyl-CoA thioesterase [Victivallales bacterium]
MYYHALDYRVAYADTDKMGFVYYGNYLVYFERTRTELLRKQGILYSELEKSGIAMPVIEANLKFHAPAHYDDIISCYGEFTSLKGLRATISCRIMRGDTLLVDGYTVLAFMDMATSKPTRISDSLRERLSSLVSS